MGRWVVTFCSNKVGSMGYFQISRDSVLVSDKASADGAALGQQ